MIRLRTLIKIPGKGFDDLTMLDVAKMVEADSSLSPDGNDSFDSSALDEFLHSAKLTNPGLIAIRDEILENIYIDRPNSKNKEINKQYLLALSRRLSG